MIVSIEQFLIIRSRFWWFLISPEREKDVIINTDEIMTASDYSFEVCSYKRNLHKFVIQKGEREREKLSKINATINYDLNVAIHLGVSLSIYFNNRFGFD